MARCTICVIFHSDPRTAQGSAWRLVAGISPSRGCAVLGGGRGGACRGLASARWGTEAWCGPPSLVHVHGTTPDSRVTPAYVRCQGHRDWEKGRQWVSVHCGGGSACLPGLSRTWWCWAGITGLSQTGTSCCYFSEASLPSPCLRPKDPGAPMLLPHFCPDPPSLPPAKGPAAAQDPPPALTLVLALAL